MAVTARNILKSWFSKDKKPTEEQFAFLIDSFLHKSDDAIGIADVQGLSNALASKASSAQINAVLSLIGSLDGLQTVDKTSIVAAINEVLSNAGGSTTSAVFPEAFVVSLPDNRTGIPNGYQVNAGDAMAPFLKLAFRKAAPPSYTAPSVSISSSPLGTFEVGETINISIDTNFNQQDGGALTGLSVKKNGIEIGTSDPYADNGVLMDKTTKAYQVTASYSQGPVKNDSLGDPYPDGQVAAGSVNSNTINYTGFYKVWYGAVAVVPADGAAARTLPQSRFENAGNVFNLDTGNALKDFVLVVPPGKSLSSVVDLDALNLVITSEYVLVDNNFTGKDAGGNNIAGCKKYVKSQAVPYSSNHRHQITLS